MSNQESYTEEVLTSRFGHHAGAIEGPNPNEVVHAEARKRFLELSIWLDRNLQHGEYKHSALKDLEVSSMWAHKAIANTKRVK